MVKKLFHILLLGSLLYLAVVYVDSVTLSVEEYGFWVSFVLLVLVVCVVELFIHPLLRLVLLPVRILTFGVISFLLSTSLVYVLTLVYPPFSISSLFGFLLLGGVFAVVQRFGM